ncbi:PKD repeat protein [Paraburkholderia atlantica]|uniref:phage tail tube protein n=1 Tax=Paraburkholderia atlantica TaxID=2654982 RepID=UPI003D1B71AE
MSHANEAISAQNTKMYLEDPNAAPQATGAVVTMSRSEPTTVILDDVSALSNGDPVLIMGTGWVSIDGQTWIVQELNRETRAAKLAHSNTTRETAEPHAGAWRLNAFVDVCAVTYTITPTAAAEIDSTTLCDEKKTSLLGFRDPGTLTFDFFINPVSPQTRALDKAYDDGESRMFQIIYRNGAVRTLPVQVQTVTETGGVDQAIQGSATLRIVGAAVLTLPDLFGDEGTEYDLIIQANPSYGNGPLDVTLIIVEQGNTASAFLVSWGDDSAAESITINTATHTYSEPGQFRIQVTPTVQGYQTAPFYGPLIYVTSAGEPETAGSAASDTGSSFAEVTHE